MLDSIVKSPHETPKGLINMSKCRTFHLLHPRSTGYNITSQQTLLILDYLVFTGESNW